jgi:hypothetical protein
VNLLMGLSFSGKTTDGWLRNRDRGRDQSRLPRSLDVPASISVGYLNRDVANHSVPHPPSGEPRTSAETMTACAQRT